MVRFAVSACRSGLSSRAANSVSVRRAPAGTFQFHPIQQMRSYGTAVEVKEVASEQEYQEEVKANQFVAIDFFATWCGPCQMIAPVFKNLSAEFPNVKFLKVDADKAGPLAAKFGVSSIPHFVFLKNGQEVDKLIGANKTELKAKLEKLK
eukprot:EG_transcript_34359